MCTQAAPWQQAHAVGALRGGMGPPGGEPAPLGCPGELVQALPPASAARRAGPQQHRPRTPTTTLQAAMRPDHRVPQGRAEWVARAPLSEAGGTGREHGL